MGGTEKGWKSREKGSSPPPNSHFWLHYWTPGTNRLNAMALKLTRVSRNNQTKPISYLNYLQCRLYKILASLQEILICLVSRLMHEDVPIFLALLSCL